MITNLQTTRYKRSLSFVYAELLKHISYSLTQAQIYHYRTNDKKEIDFIVQKADKIFAIELKSSQSIKKDAFKHIIDFQNKSQRDTFGPYSLPFLYRLFMYIAIS
ncbi:MAG: hypothetical protein DRG30_06835 [Epsilonproteobacteria bacterium]|nr:MAG: hypothetical protein DRG30_06835 [Campylobacterota bacterium]